jgi:hypothetical protein
MQSSGRAQTALFLGVISKAFLGQKATHMPQPLHHSASITTFLSDFGFASCILPFAFPLVLLLATCQAAASVKNRF